MVWRWINEIEGAVVAQAKERMVKMVRKLIEERKMVMNNTNNDGDDKGAAKDAVDVLLRDNSDEPSLSLETISGNIIEMMIPGEETLPTAMTLAVKFLTDCPVALSKLVVRSFMHTILLIIMFKTYY